MSENQTELSRGDIINWINDLLKLNITKIECLGTGAIQCQILDILYPKKVPLNKVNWKAKFEYEFIYNFKILQQSFTKLGIQKHIEVEKLVKAKYQDNLEFIQWMKKYFDQNYTPREYDAVGRRGGLDVDCSFVEKMLAKNTIPLGKKLSEIKGIQPIGKSSSGKCSNDTSFSTIKENFESFIKIERNEVYDVMKNERDFYFNKLALVDHYTDACKNTDDPALFVQNIREILYAGPDKVFRVNDKEGELELIKKDEDILSDITQSMINPVKKINFGDSIIVTEES